MSSPTKIAGNKKTLQEFGYAFNDKGELRQIDPESGDLTDKPFDFEISDSRAENQKNYEALGECITEYVYELLDKYGLYRIYLPEDQPKSKATFVFSTKQELKDVDKLMILINGSGVVRAGQWARSLIINHSIDAGTVLPYVKKAQALGFDVLITNTNDNDRDGEEIIGSETPETHAETVWKKLVQPSNAKSIAVVAHSYGGHVATKLSSKFREDFENKVFAVAFTDSVHSSYGVKSRLSKIGTNFVSSSKPLGTLERSYSGDMPRVSAGHTKHEMTSFSCIDALFEFVEKMYKQEREIKADDSASEETPIAAKKSKKEEEL